MNLIILGSGGCQAIPRPLCTCPNCSKARKIGVPWARTGPSMFIEDESILFDTPEEIRQQIEREKIKDLKYVFYTHWHPDHTQGLRIFEQINSAYNNEPRRQKIIVYIPQNEMSDFQKFRSDIFYYQDRGWIEIREVKDRMPVKIGTVSVTPLDFRRPDRVRYGYLIEKDGKRAVFASCSQFGLYLDKHYENLDLVMIEKGWFGKTETTRNKLPAGHPWLDHVSFEENIAMIKKIRPKMVILMHIDGARHRHIDGNHEHLLKVAKEYSDLNLQIAYDGMRIDL